MERGGRLKYSCTHTRTLLTIIQKFDHLYLLHLNEDIKNTLTLFVKNLLQAVMEGLWRLGIQ